MTGTDQSPTFADYLAEAMRRHYGMDADWLPQAQGIVAQLLASEERPVVFLATLDATPSLKVRPEWLDAIDAAIKVLGGQSRYGLIVRLKRLRDGLSEYDRLTREATDD